MTFNVDEIVLNPQAESFFTLLDSGYLELRSGVQPASLASAATGDLIATVVFNNPCIDGAASGGVAICDIPDEVSAVLGGTIGWGRAYKTDNTPVFDGEVTESGNGGDIIATTLIVVLGDKVNILGFTYTRS